MNLFDADSYKLSQPWQYEPGTNRMFCYQEARVDGKYEYINFFGLRYILEQWVNDPITHEEVEEANEFWTSHGVPFHRKGWTRLVTKHGGHFPVEIRSVDEGAMIPRGRPLVTVESLDEELFWVAGYIETMLSRLWYPCTVSTISYRIKDVIANYLLDTHGNVDSLNYKLHDFGSRGVSSRESAAIGGAAHLVHFLGTDNGMALKMLRDVYGEHMAGYSIAAMEHSTVTSWGEAREKDSYLNMLRRFGKPGKTIACVSDSYDIYNACDKIWGQELREDVINSGATVVIRPDSGDPVETVIGCLRLLADRFGTTAPYKGYRLLNHVRVLQGDGVNPFSIEQICKAMMANGFSIENIAFGMGGALLQKCDRDTFSFAYKCSEVSRFEETKEGDRTFQVRVHTPVYKRPKYQTLKASYQGLLDTVQYPDGEIVTVNRRVDGYKLSSIMKTRYRAGQLANVQSLAGIRKIAA